MMSEMRCTWGRDGLFPFLSFPHSAILMPFLKKLVKSPTVRASLYRGEIIKFCWHLWRKQICKKVLYAEFMLSHISSECGWQILPHLREDGDLLCICYESSLMTYKRRSGPRISLCVQWIHLGLQWAIGRTSHRDVVLFHSSQIHVFLKELEKWQPSKRGQKRF